MGGTQTAGLLTTVLVAVSDFIKALAARWNDLNQLIVSHLGQTGQWAFWAFSALVILLVVAYATRFVFQILRWVIVPAAALSIAALTLAPSWPPMQTFPVFLGLTGLAMMVKGR